MSRQTFLDALSRRHASGRPVFGTGTSIACRDLMAATGAYFPEAHLDPEKMALLAVAGHRVLGFDVVMPLFSVCHEAAAMGCNVGWGGPDGMPESGKPIFAQEDDIRIPDDLLDRPGFRVPLEAIRLLKKWLGDDAAVCGKVMGGWTQGYHYFGVENFLIGTLDDPAKTRRIVDRLSEVTIRFANAQVEAGADCILLADHATRDLCSPQTYVDFLVPVHRRLAAEIRVPVILHICGSTAVRIGSIAGTGLAGFHWDTKTGPPDEVRRLAGTNLALMGGISNYKLLRGRSEEIRADAETAVRAGIDIVGPECAIPLGTPLANLKAVATVCPGVERGEAVDLGRRAFLAQSAAGAAALVGVHAAAKAAERNLEVSDLQQKLLDCLGGPWPEACDLKPQIRQTQQKEGYRLISVTYEVGAGDRVPAYLLIPDGITPSHPAPAVAIWHQHNGAYHLGKVEPAGLAGSPMHHTGVALAKEGFVVLCPDALCFGERQSKQLHGGDFERFEFLRYVVAGKSMAWKNILDMRRAIDYLVSRPEVRSDRMGCYGHSMGSTHTWLVGPWEPRLKCLVCNCCLPTYAAIHRTHILHCFPNFIPGWGRYGDTPDIAALIAPRALHMNFGALDGGSPIAEVREGMKTIALAYEKAGAADRFSHFIEEDTGHVLSEAMWQRARDWLRKHLG